MALLLLALFGFRPCPVLLVAQWLTRAKTEGPRFFFPVPVFMLIQLNFNSFPSPSLIPAPDVPLN